MRFVPRSVVALAAAAALLPLSLRADSKKLKEDQRIEILRGVTAEYAKVKTLLPISKKPLEFHADGTWDQDKWKESAKEFGPAGRIGDLIQVTHISIEKDRIILELNGGGKARGKWTDHIQVGMGNRTTPISGGQTNAPGGTVVTLLYDGPIGETNSEEVKKLLLPILDFEKSSVTTDYVESLPEPIKEAVRSKKVIEGMNRDQVILAVGKPVRKVRDNKEGTEYEDWIYGEPPGRVSFVTFTGDKVVRVKETYAGLGGSISQGPVIQ
ncbi:MAG: hypothetical protein ABL995_10445 [Bryobacteraceae bacterium]